MESDFVEILSEIPTEIGGKWVLVKYENDFYAYGTEHDLHSFYGFPVNQCGSKEKVLTHCKSIVELCRNHIKKYQKELEKDKTEGWGIMIKNEQKELEMLAEFTRILSQ